MHSKDMPKTSTLLVTRGVVWGTALVLVVALLCVRLGIWQLQRLEYKRNRNEGTRVRMAQPPAALTAISQDTSGLLFRRVVLDGGYDDPRTVIIAGRSLRGVPGVHVLTPMRIGGAAVLVNRGWMPSADAASIEVDSIREPPPQDLQALLTPFPADFGDPVQSDTFQHVWHLMDGRLLRGQFPYPVLPLVAQILPHPDQPLYPIRLKAPQLDEGPHLGYAVQWFSFAAIAIVGWLVLLITRRRRETRAHKGVPDRAT